MMDDDDEEDADFDDGGGSNDDDDDDSELSGMSDADDEVRSPSKAVSGTLSGHLAIWPCTSSDGPALLDQQGFLGYPPVGTGGPS